MQTTNGVDEDISLDLSRSVVHTHFSSLNLHEILCGASMDRGNESLIVKSGLHDQDCRHAHLWLKKTFKIQNRQADFHKTWYAAFGMLPIIVCSNDYPMMTSTYFTTRSILETKVFTYEKVKIMD